MPRGFRLPCGLKEDSIYNPKLVEEPPPPPKTRDSFVFLQHPLMHGTFPVVLVNTQQLAGVVSLMPLFGKKRRGQREDKKKKTLCWLESLTQIQLYLLGSH